MPDRKVKVSDVLCASITCKPDWKCQSCDWQPSKESVRLGSSKSVAEAKRHVSENPAHVIQREDFTISQYYVS